MEIVEVAPGRGLLVIPRCRALENIKGVRLIEISPRRFLIMLRPELTVESIEVQMRDAIEQRKGSREDLDIVKELLGHLGHQRRKEAISKRELLTFSI